MIEFREYIFALVCHANAALAGYRTTKPLLHRWQFFDQQWIVFAEGTDGKNGPAGRLLFPSPEAWFDDLAARGAKCVRLWRRPEDYETSDLAMATASGVGLGWMIVEAVLPGGRSELWCEGIDAPASIRPKRELWIVVRGWLLAGLELVFSKLILEYRFYGQEPRCMTFWRYECLPTIGKAPAPPVDEAHLNLEQALIEVLDFARSHGATYTGYVDRGLGDIRSSRPYTLTGYRYAPKGALSLKARQVIRAMRARDMFAGRIVGDMYFESEEAENTHYRVTGNLAKALDDAAVAVVNTVPRPRRT